MAGPLEMSALDLGGRRLLIRADLNAPIEDGRVRSDARLRAELPTLNAAISKGARVILMSHLGRPEEGKFDAKLSLKPVAERLGELLGRDVPVVADWIDGVDVAPGEVVLTENVRFLTGEHRKEPGRARRMGSTAGGAVVRGPLEVRRLPGRVAPRRTRAAVGATRLR